MGNSCSCHEEGHWTGDGHPEITEPYKHVELGPATQDMTAPLSHYFISSGHNSYLTSDQLVGSAGTATIIKAAASSSSTVTVAPKGPSVSTVAQLPKPVSFKACIEACRDYGFKVSKYPVIITLENHADAEGQAEMVRIFKEVLGEQLFIPPSTHSPEWLSPETLKGKFLIRANADKAVEELRSIVYISNTKFKGFTEMNTLGHVSSSSLMEKKISILLQPLGHTFNKSFKKDGTVVVDKDKVPTSSGLQSAESSSALRQDKGRMGREQAAAQRGHEEEEEGSGEGEEVEPISSLREAFAYTNKHLMRVYPAGWRVASGNYDPSPAWSLGASFVALNWQSWDKALWVNQAKFRDNGGCGYIKKPEWMLAAEDLVQRQPRLLRVHVYSAFKDQGMACMCAKDDLVVKLEIKGMAVDCVKQLTNAVQDSGKLKVDKTYEFPVEYPEMAQLLICLLDEDTGSKNDVLGYFSVSLASLQPGKYRLQLRGEDGEVLPDSWIKVELSWRDQDTKNPLAAGRVP